MLPGRLLLVSGLLALLAGCAAPPPTPDSTKIEAGVAATRQFYAAMFSAAQASATALAPTLTATFTQTPTPTLTPTATATSTATATPLPSGTVNTAAQLRAGPGTVYPALASLAAGQTATPTGKTADGAWFRVTLPDGTEGWLPADRFDLTGDPTTIPVITDLLPTPTRPPATHTPVPTATGTPSPWSCQMWFLPGITPTEILLYGAGWAPEATVSLAYTVTDPLDGRVYVNRTYPVTTTSATADPPGGFTHVIHRQGENNLVSVTATGPGCVRTLRYP